MKDFTIKLLIVISLTIVALKVTANVYINNSDFPALVEPQSFNKSTRFLSVEYTIHIDQMARADLLITELREANKSLKAISEKLK